MMQRRGICVLGNLIADLHFQVARYPGRGELAAIQGGRDITVGGLACNTALSLSMLDPGLPLLVSGSLGEDTEGRFIRERFMEHPNIDTSRIKKGSQTAYTLVINEQESKERTFFTSTGSGSELDSTCLDLSTLDARILHAGYILLMDGLDREDGEYGTQMARLLCMAQQRGIETSVDVVTERGDRFTRLVPPALRYTDYCVINELEAQQVSGVALRTDKGRLLPENMGRALQALKAFGVRRWAAIHCPEGAFGLDETGTTVALPSLSLPEGYIKSTTGAGDAFCSGVLYGAHEGWELQQSLRLGTAAASLSLSGADSYSAIKKAPEALAFYWRMGGQ